MGKHITKATIEHASEVPAQSESSHSLRDDYCIARALHIAAAQILAEPMGAMIDARDMQDILRERYPSFVRVFEFQDDFQAAIKLGFVPTCGQSIEHADLKEWLAERHAEIAKDRAARYGGDDSDLPF